MLRSPYSCTGGSFHVFSRCTVHRPAGVELSPSHGVHPCFYFRFNPMIVEIRQAWSGYTAQESHFSFNHSFSRISRVTTFASVLIGERKPQLVPPNQYTEPIYVGPAQSRHAHPLFGFYPTPRSWRYTELNGDTSGERATKWSNNDMPAPVIQTKNGPYLAQWKIEKFEKFGKYQISKSSKKSQKFTQNSC